MKAFGKLLITNAIIENFQANEKILKHFLLTCEQEYLQFKSLIDYNIYIFMKVLKKRKQFW